MAKRVYSFGDGKAEGPADIRDVQGGNLVEMSTVGLPLPPDFTTTIEVGTGYYANNDANSLEPREQMGDAIGAVFGTWMNQRPIANRCLYSIPEICVTAVGLQARLEAILGVHGNDGTLASKVRGKRCTQKPTKPPANKEPRAIDLAMIDSSLLKQRLAHEIEGRRTERFYWVFALIIVLDVIVFPQLGWVLFWIFLLQVIFLIGLARWLHIDPVVVLLQRLFDRHLAVGAKKDHDEASPS